MATALALLVCGCLLAVKAGLAADRFLPSLDLPRGPLAEVKPIWGKPPERLARRVVLVLIDGLRLDQSYGRPFLDGLRRRGIDAAARTHYPSMSRPNHASILTGVDPRWSGIRTNAYTTPVALDSLMGRARAAGLRVTFLSDGYDGIVEMFPDSFTEVSYASQEGFTERAAERALANGDDLVLLYFDDVDDAGHEFGGASPEYRDAARRVDTRLAALLAGLDLTRDAVVVVSDHGHIDKGGHGGVEPEVMAVPLIMAGAGVQPGAVVRDAQLIDVAPTVAALLGLPSPGHALGRTLLEALVLPGGDRGLIAANDGVRRTTLVPLTTKLDRETHRQARSTRIRRGAFVVVGFLLLAALTAWVGSRRIVILDRRVLLIAVPAFPILFYGMVATFEAWLSPSMVPQRGDVTSKLFAYGGVAAVVNLVASWAALRRRAVPGDRLAAAAGIVFVGLVVAIAPAGAAWAVSGRPVTVMLPPAGEIMLPPVAYSAFSCFAGSATLLMAVEYVVFLARASDPLRFPRA